MRTGKSFLLAAFVSTVALGFPAAVQAIDITIGGEGGADVTVGAEVGVEIGIGAGGDAGAGAGGGAGAGAALGGEVTADGMVTIRAAGEGGEATVALDSLVGMSVSTSDEVQVGVVSEVATDAQGRAVLVVEVAEGWLEAVNRIAVYASAVMQVDAGLSVAATDADLKASVTAGLAAGAAAGGG